jgi:hypothetical protein
VTQGFEGRGDRELNIPAFNPLRRRRLAVVALCLAAGVAGCGDKENCWGGWCGDDPPPDPPAFLPRTSPSNLLHNLQKAYEKRNIAEYESLLAKDFTFVLSVDDQERPGIPDSWGHDPEVLIHTRLFDPALVQMLTLTFVPVDSVWDTEDSIYTALISNVNLFLVGATPAHPTDVMEYRISNGRAKFWFRKNGWTVPGKADSIWTIVRWQDNPVGGLATRGSAGVDPMSWGRLKAAFL